MLQRLLLLSVVFAVVVLPAWAARDPRPARGVRRLLWAFLLFNGAYQVALRVVYPRL